MKWCIPLLTLVLMACMCGFMSSTVVASTADSITSLDLNDAVSCLSLAQDDSDSEYSGSTRVRTRGLGKLIGLIIAGIIGLASFIMKMFRRGDS